jgi:hypothetical protein
MIFTLILCLLQVQDYPFGPLGTSTHGIFQTATVGFIPNVPTNIKQDEFSSRILMESAQVFNNELKGNPNYFANFEFDRLSFDTQYGISDKWQVGINIPVESIDGGVLDGFIIHFHDTFGINQNGRTNYPRDKAILLVNDQQMVHPQTSIGDIMLNTNYKILTDINYPQIMVGLQVKLPTAGLDTLYIDHRPGVGLSINTFYEIEGWYSNLGISVATTGGGTILDQKLRWYENSIFFMVEKQLFDQISVVAELTTQSGIAIDFGQFSKWSWTSVAGFKYRIDKNLVIELGITEHIILFSNNADFGVFTGLTYKY